MTMLPVNGQSQILSAGYSPWQAPLAAIFSGISAAGQPGGLSNFGVGVGQGLQNFQQGQQNQQMMQLRQMQIEQAQEEQRRANQEEAQRQAKLKLIQDALAGSAGSPTQTGGPGGIQTASAPQGQSALLAGLSPQQSALFSTYAQVDPEAAFKMLSENVFAEPDQIEATSGIGKINQDFKNGLIDEATRDALIKKETYIAPQAPQELWEDFTDPTTGMRGQRNTLTHKVTWDPGQTGGIQVDTDHDGKPDITFGGGGMTAPTATASTANVKALLINQGLEDLTKIDFSKVSAPKMAAADFANSKGAGGEFVANLMMNDDEKRLMGAQGAIQEAVISAITGAAYSDEQKRNMRAKYVILPTDSAPRRAEKIKASAEFLQQLDRNSGNTRIPTDSNGGGGTVIDGYTITPVD